MKLILKVGLVLGTVGILMGGMVLALNAATSPDRPGPNEPKAFLHIELVNSSEDVDGPVTEYTDLTPDQQSFFEQAMSDDSFGTPIPDDINSSVWYDNRVVRYQNRTYRVSVSES